MKEPCQVESSWTTPSIFLLSSGATIKSNSFLEMACHTDQEKKMKFWKSWFFQSKIGHANFAQNSILELFNELLLVSCSVLLDAHAIFGLIWYTMGLGTSQICIFRSLMLPSSRSMGYRILLNQGKIGHFLPNFCYSYHVSTYIFECVGLFFENFWIVCPI